MKRLVSAAMAAALVFFCGLLVKPERALAGGPAPYKLVKTIDLPGAKGGVGGTVAFDADTGTVWLCQSPNKNLVVIETRSNTVRQVVEGMENGSGIAFGERFAFVSDAANNATIVYGKRSFEKATELKPGGSAPAGTYFDPRRGDLWVTAGEEMTIFKAVGRGGFKRLAGLRLKPGPAKTPPGTGLYAATKDRLYQPFNDVVDVINPASRKIEHVWKSGSQGVVTNIGYDAKSDRLVLGTTAHEVIVLDAKLGKVIAKIAVSGPVDDVAVDSSLRRAYGADRLGQIDVIDLDRNTLLATVPSDPELHGVTVDPRTHFVYAYRDQANKVDVFAPQ